MAIEMLFKFLKSFSIHPTLLSELCMSMSVRTCEQVIGGWLGFGKYKESGITVPSALAQYITETLSLLLPLIHVEFGLH